MIQIEDPHVPPGHSASWVDTDSTRTITVSRGQFAAAMEVSLVGLSPSDAQRCAVRNIVAELDILALQRGHFTALTPLLTPLKCSSNSVATLDARPNKMRPLSCGKAHQN